MNLELHLTDICLQVAGRTAWASFDHRDSRQESAAAGLVFGRDGFRCWLPIPAVLLPRAMPRTSWAAHVDLFAVDSDGWLSRKWRRWAAA